MYQKYKEEAAFLFIYVREAHPADDYIPPGTDSDKIVFPPRTFEERAQTANLCAARLDIQFPTLVDPLDNRTAADYRAWPDRIYVVDVDGKLAYKSRPGPAGFRVPELEAVLESMGKRGQPVERLPEIN